MQKKILIQLLSDLRKHIGITFHRYINGDQRKIIFVVNGINCEAYDPFFSDRSTPLPRKISKLIFFPVKSEVLLYQAKTNVL